MFPVPIIREGGAGKSIGNWLDVTVLRVAYCRYMQARSIRTALNKNKENNIDYQSEHGERNRRARSREPIDNNRYLNQVEGEAEPCDHHKKVLTTEFIEPL